MSPMTKRIVDLKEGKVSLGLNYTLSLEKSLKMLQVTQV